MVFLEFVVCAMNLMMEILKSQEPFRFNAYEIRARGDQSLTKEETTSARHDHSRKAHSGQLAVQAPDAVCESRQHTS